MLSVYRPAPINQFYRLDYDEIHKRYVKTTERWNNIRYVNGVSHNFDAENCMAAAGAVALDAQTLGNQRTSPAGIRNWQDDFKGGIGVDDIDVAWHRHYGQDLIVPSDYSWGDSMYAVRIQRRHMVVGVVYNVMPDEYQHQLPGNFDHALNIDAVDDSGRILVFDGLGTNPEWMPQSAVRGAAEALAARVRGNKGALFVGFTRSRPVIMPPTKTVSVHPEKGTRGYPKYRYFGLYTVSGSVVTKSEVRRTGGFSATCTDPEWYSWPGHSRQELVKIESGFLSGKNYYVRSAYVVEK